MKTSLKLYAASLCLSKLLWWAMLAVATSRAVAAAHLVNAKRGRAFSLGRLHPPLDTLAVATTIVFFAAWSRSSMSNVK